MSTTIIPNATEKHLVDQDLELVKSLDVGTTNWYTVTPDSHYRIVNNLQSHALADDLSVMRVEANLVISYADGTTLVALDYFACGANKGEPDADSTCSLTIAGDTEEGYSVPAGAGGYATPNHIVYHHGDQSAFKLLLQQGSISDQLALAQMLETQAQPALGPIAIPLWAPLAGGAAALGGLGSSNPAINTIINKGFSIVGTIVLGPVIAGQDLQVKAYKQDGSELAAATVSDDGTYKLTSLEDYQGLVLIKVIDTDTGRDYLDEATGKGKSLTTDLRAVTYIDTGSSKSFDISVNSVTEAAVRKMGLALGEKGSSSHVLQELTQEQVTTINQYIAKLLGINNVDIIADKAIAVIDSGNNVNTSANSYGELLAALSGMGASKQASVSAIIDMLLAAMGESDISDTLKLELMSGALVGRANATKMGESLGVEDASSVATVWQAVSKLVAAQKPHDAQLDEAQWKLIGVDNLTNSELQWLNDAVANNANKSNYAVSDLTALVDLAKDVMQAETPKITQQQFATLGISNINSAEQASLLNNILTKLDAGAVADLDKLQKIANSVNGVLDAINDASASKEDYATLGISGVTDANLAKVNAAITEAGSSKTTLVQLQGVVDGGLKAYSVDVINNAAAGNTDATTPTKTDFAQAGIAIAADLNVGEAVATIGRYSSGLDSKPYTSEQLTSLLNAHTNLVAATSTDANAPPTLLSTNELAALGVATSGSTVSDKGLEVLAQVIDGRALSDVNTTGQLQALADVIEKWVALVDDTTPAPTSAMTAAEVALIGLDAVNDESKGAAKVSFLHQITANKNIGEVDELVEIETLNTALKHFFITDEAGSISLTLPDLTSLGLHQYTNSSNESVVLNDYHLPAIQKVINNTGDLDQADSLQRYKTAIGTAAKSTNDDMNAVAGHADSNTTALITGNFDHLGLDVLVKNEDMTNLGDLLHWGQVKVTDVDTWEEIQSLVVMAQKINNPFSHKDQTKLAAEGLADQLDSLGRALLTDSASTLINDIIAAADNVILKLTDNSVDVTKENLTNLGVTFEGDITTENLATINTKINGFGLSANLNSIVELEKLITDLGFAVL